MPHMLKTLIDKIHSEPMGDPCATVYLLCCHFFLVGKKDGSYRPVMNFKDTLNKVLKDPDPYPMPSIDQIFANQVMSGYNHVICIKLFNPKT